MFNNEDAEAGVKGYMTLAGDGHINSMCASGVCLIEGIGVEEADNKNGVKFLKEAIEKAEHPQALYELGVLHYTGGAEPVVEENHELAFRCFSKSAKLGKFSYSEYMIADMLLDNSLSESDAVKLDQNHGKAVNLLYESAEKGHRTARGVLLSILDNKHALTKEVVDDNTTTLKRRKTREEVNAIR